MNKILSLWDRVRPSRENIYLWFWAIVFTILATLVFMSPASGAVPKYFNDEEKSSYSISASTLDIFPLEFVPSTLYSVPSYGFVSHSLIIGASTSPSFSYSLKAEVLENLSDYCKNLKIKFTKEDKVLYEGEISNLNLSSKLEDDGSDELDISVWESRKSSFSLSSLLGLFGGRASGGGLCRLSYLVESDISPMNFNDKENQEIIYLEKNSNNCFITAWNYFLNWKDCMIEKRNAKECLKIFGLKEEEEPSLDHFLDLFGCKSRESNTLSSGGGSAEVLPPEQVIEITINDTSQSTPEESQASSTPSSTLIEIEDEVLRGTEEVGVAPASENVPGSLDETMEHIEPFTPPIEIVPQDL